MCPIKPCSPPAGPQQASSLLEPRSLAVLTPTVGTQPRLLGRIPPTPQAPNREGVGCYCCGGLLRVQQMGSTHGEDHRYSGESSSLHFMRTRSLHPFPLLRLWLETQEVPGHLPQGRAMSYTGFRSALTWFPRGWTLVAVTDRKADLQGTVQTSTPPFSGLSVLILGFVR